MSMWPVVSRITCSLLICIPNSPLMAVLKTNKKTPPLHLFQSSNWWKETVLRGLGFPDPDVVNVQLHPLSSHGIWSELKSVVCWGICYLPHSLKRLCRKALPGDWCLHMSSVLPLLAVQLKLHSWLPNPTGKGRILGKVCVSCQCNGDFARCTYKAALLAEREMNDPVLSRSSLLLAPVWGSHWFPMLLGNCRSIFLCQKPDLPDGVWGTVVDFFIAKLKLWMITGRKSTANPKFFQ